MKKIISSSVMHNSDSALLQTILRYVCCIGLAIVYLSHLGYTPIDNETDEARRALVAAEMMLSGDYLTPTLNGEIYLNKPPLYNWILTGYFELFDNFSVFALRLQVIVATFITGFFIYYFAKKYTSRNVAFFTAFAFMTNGRILIYDSLLSFIDTTFSLVVYLSFMLIFLFGERKKYYALYISTSVLCAAGFLMKGLPAIVFQGFSLLTYFIIRRDFKKIFHAAHFTGVFIFLLITGTYYFLYFSKNNLEPQVLFGNLFNESMKRTATQYGIGKTILHIFTFPFELLYHFAPWTLFLIACIRKNTQAIIKKNPFLHYSAWILLINIIPYWTSVEVYARYLFMFVPLLYSIFLYVYFEETQKSSVQYKIIRAVIFSLCTLFLIFSFLLPFLKATNRVDEIYLKTTVLIIGFSIALWLLVKKSLYVYAFALSIIFMRAGFNWFVVEQRGARYFIAERLSKQIVEQTKGHELYILKDAQIGNFDGMSFQICTGRHEVLRITPFKKPGAFYIADTKQLKEKNYTSYISFTNYLSDSLKLVQFDSADINSLKH